MGVNADVLLLAEPLRYYFVEHLPPALLPVPGGFFSLDGLMPDGVSMSLQISGGQALRTYIDGSRKMSMPFTIFYRSTDAVEDNEAKSAMLGVLNGIGAWMQEKPLPFLGDWLKISQFEQVQLANIADQTEQYITYQAGYTLGYTTI